MVDVSYICYLLSTLSLSFSFVSILLLHVILNGGVLCRPSTDNKIIHLSKQGVQNLVVVPISFVSEHIETLEEIDLEYHELAEEHNIHHWKRVPALNTDASFIEELSSVVVRYFYINEFVMVLFSSVVKESIYQWIFLVFRSMLCIKIPYHWTNLWIFLSKRG